MTKYICRLTVTGVRRRTDRKADIHATAWSKNGSASIDSEKLRGASCRAAAAADVALNDARWSRVATDWRIKARLADVNTSPLYGLLAAAWRHRQTGNKGKDLDGWETTAQGMLGDRCWLEKTGQRVTRETAYTANSLRRAGRITVIRVNRFTDSAELDLCHLVDSANMFSCSLASQPPTFDVPSWSRLHISWVTVLDKRSWHAALAPTRSRYIRLSFADL